MQGMAKIPHWPIGYLGCFQKGLAFLRSEVNPAAVAVEQVFALSANCYRIEQFCNNGEESRGCPMKFCARSCLEELAMCFRMVNSVTGLTASTALTPTYGRT